MFEYKVVPAPARVSRVRGLKTTGDRFAHTLTETLNTLGGEGWEFLRSETLPCEERKGWFGGTRVSTQTVMVFRRSIPGEPAIPAAASRTGAPSLVATAPGGRGPALTEPPPLSGGTVAGPDPDGGRAEPVFRAGALMRTEAERRFPPLRQTPDARPQSEAGDESR
jgi:hypothetical protein